MIGKVMLLATCFALFGACAVNKTNPGEVFEQLKTLVGEWEGKTDAGRVLRVSYRLVANNTVLVETWTLAPQREALTLYHMDNGSLMATHYCPLGNQPRLRLKVPSTSPSFIFEFVSATNLPKTELAHQHQFEIQLLGTDSFSRSETYVENGTAESERVTYSRAR